MGLREEIKSMEHEYDNGCGTGDGKGPDYHTDNREPVIVAEQPAREVKDGTFGRENGGREAGGQEAGGQNAGGQEAGGQNAAAKGTPGRECPDQERTVQGSPVRESPGQGGSDGWSSPIDTPLREDRWSDGDKPYLGSPWEPSPSGTAYGPGKENGASGNDSQPIYHPAPASYGQRQPGAGQGQPGQGQPGPAQGGSAGMGSGSVQRDGSDGRGNSRYQSQYQTQYQTQYQSGQPVYQEKNNMATASLVMGILSVCSICCCLLFGIVFGALGIIFAIMSKKENRMDGKMDGQAKAGLILSIIGIAVTVLIVILFVAVEVLYVIPGLD
jgi:hypothetical protein